MTAPARECQPEAAPVRRRAPTPWQIGITLYPYRHFYGPADKDGFCPAVGSCVTALGEAYDVANAAFIVEAVNSNATLRARVDELTKALEWQPIDTAPKLKNEWDDPASVMLWVADGGGKGSGCHAFGRVYRYEDGTTRAVASGFAGNWRITHWMPLPGGPVVPLEDRS